MTLADRWRQSSLRMRLLMSKYGPLLDLSDRERMINIALRFVKLNRVSGDYYEFGVGEGYTLGTTMRFADHLHVEMNFNGYDSFEGLPDIDPIDIGGGFSKGDYCYTLDHVIKKLKLKHIYYNNNPLESHLQSRTRARQLVTLHKTWFENLYHVPQQTPAAIVWIDCDLYKSTMSALQWITSLLQSGTIMCFDDWYCYKGNPLKGEALAFRTWRTEVEDKLDFIDYHRFGWHGRSFIVYRR